MATALVLLALAAVLALAVKRLHRDVKSGACPGGCSGCSGGCPHATHR